MSSATHPIKAHVDYPVTDFVMTYRDSHGRPTLTQTISAQASTQTTIYKDAKGQPTKTDVLVILREPRKTTYTDYQGRATKTQDYYVVESAKVLFDKYGHPTATETSMISETAAARTLFNELGVATETDTILVPMSATTTLVVTPTAAATPSPQDDKTVRIVPMSDGTYFAGLMLPILFAIVLSIPIRMLDQTAKLYQPFHALKSFRGASAAQSLCFQTTGVGGLLAGLRSLLSGQVLPSLTGILVLTSAVLIPLSAEAIHIILAGPECTSSAQVETLTCALTLGISPGPARAIVALLSTMAFLVVAAAAVLWKWKTGLARNPWSLFYMAELSANHDIRLLLRRLREKNGRIRNSDVSKALAGIPFELNYWKDNGVLKYSVLISNESAHPPKKDKSVTFAKPSRKRRGKKGKHPMPFFILTWAGTGLFLLLLCAALIGILTYDITSKDHGYDPGMLGGWSAIRFFFTGAAVAITLLWGSFFYAVAFLSPHRLLHRNRLYKGKALHMTPPVNSFSGIWSSLATGRRDLYLAAVSGTAILSEILPLFVSIILDRGIQNQLAQEICTWMAVGILCVMILTACGSFFVAWPHMPIDPSTVAGAMYYVWDPTTQSSVVSMSPSSGLLFGRVGANMV
ncbi:hypothetical protein F4779DRAFT_631085 [Xylariaceae sp. FL0662B]|nr:hypothetical protein F4779DRAFT_631085 [Xylariaceae sp. FL0662B]